MQTVPFNTTVTAVTVLFTESVSFTWITQQTVALPTDDMPMDTRFMPEAQQHGATHQAGQSSGTASESLVS